MRTFSRFLSCGAKHLGAALKVALTSPHGMFSCRLRVGILSVDGHLSLSTTSLICDLSVDGLSQFACFVGAAACGHPFQGWVAPLAFAHREVSF